MKIYKLILTLFCIIFLLNFSSSQEECILDGGVVLIPAPTPDPNFTGAPTYPPETTVQMCFTVEEYNTPGTQNWMHGIVPLFGPGWDISTLQPVGQPETQFWAGGQWIWTGNVVAGITNELIAPPGWWFDADSGGGNLDGDPSNNWGDGNNGPWEFCWEITTQSSPPAFNGANLIVEILNFADSETGSWDSPGELEFCIDDPSFFIQPLELDAPTCDESFLTVVNPTCATEQNGGTAFLTPSGTGPFDYLLFSLETGDVIDQWNNQPIDVTVIANNLNPGGYLFQVVDLGFPGGCASPVNFDILIPEQFEVFYEVNDASCVDSSDGYIEINQIVNENCVDESLIPEEIDFSLCPSNPDPVCGCDFNEYFNACHAESFYGITLYDLGPCPDENSDFVVSWSGPNGFNSTNFDILDVPPAIYELSIECVDNTSPVFGCTYVADIEVSSPSQISNDFSISNVSCYVDLDSNGVNDISDGSINIELNGGSPPYTTNLESVDGSFSTTLSGSNLSFENLSAGDYFFSSFDTNNCLLPQQEVFFSIVEPSDLIVESFTVSDFNGFGTSCVSAQDGFINIEISGGTPPYDFLWSDNSTNQNLSNAPAGVYSVIVIDQNSCSTNLDNVVIEEPLPININAIVNPVSCSGFSDGSITVDISGATPPYDFNWLNLNSNNITISDLTVGNYTIEIIDDNSCVFEETFSVNTPNPISINEIVTNVSCFGSNDGSISVSASGGLPPYNFEWSNLELTQDITSLAPDTYSLVVTDSEGCFETLEVEIIEPEILSASPDVSDVLCFGDNTGSILSNITGGTPPYQETWSGGANPNALSAGFYDLTVTDSNGCILILDDIEVNEPQFPLQVDATVTDVFPCFGDETGVLAPSATGGTGNYSFSILESPTFFGLSSGTYTVVVEDENGCSNFQIFNVNQPSSISAVIDVTNISCSGLDDGQVNVSPSGGTPPYSIVYNDLSNGGFVNNFDMSPGLYSVSIQDSFDCSYIDYFTIEEPQPNSMDITFNDNPSCLNDFEIFVTNSSGGSGFWSGTGPGSVSFSNQFGLNTIVSVTDYGTYIISYTDGCGEQVNQIVTMESVPPEIISPSIVFCDFEVNIQADSESSEGFWSVVDSPENTQVSFVDGNTSFNTNVLFNPVDLSQPCCYGDYVFSFTSCGSETFKNISLEKEAPTFGVSTFQDCSLDGQIFIINPISPSDALVDPGDWQSGKCIEDLNNNGICDDDEWVETNDVLIYYETPYEVGFTVPEFGQYEFRYFICDTFYRKIVGFSCPLQIPNTFTPNGDSQNDLFTVEGLIPGIHTNIDFVVFNRDGQIVHSKSNFDFQNMLWDGTTNTFDDSELVDGVYYYVLELFNTASQRQEYYNGYIHLFRN